MSEGKDLKVIKLDANNWVIWKWQFNNVLRAKKLTKVFTPGQEESCDSNVALALLGSSLSEDNMLKIVNCTRFIDAWNTLERCFENKTSYEPQSLYRQLNSYKISSVSEVSAGLSEIQGIVAQLKNLKEDVSDNCLIGAILSALPSCFDTFITVWKNSADKDKDSLISKLMAEASEQACKEKEETRALAARGKFKKGIKRNERNHQSEQIDKDECRYCHEKGHWISECPNLKEPYDPNRNRQRRNEQGQGANSGKDSKGFSFITRSPAAYNWPKEMWVADSGCTNHMSPFKDIFSTITESHDIKNVQLADDVSIEVKGLGDIETKHGTISNVLYIPELAQNLFSISAAASKGLTHIGHKDKLTFYHDKDKIFTANLQDNLYMIKFEYKVNVSRANAATLGEWHARFGHVATETIVRMKRDNVVEGLEITTKRKEHCQDCKLNKCTRAHHPSRTTPKVIKAGTVLHIDTAGPSNIVSHGKSRYFVLCKDEATRYRLVAFVETKDQIPFKVKEFITKAILETGNQVLKIVTDCGTEMRGDLTKFLEQRGILHEVSVPHTPSQNGYIERDIRTIKEAAKTMLNKSKLNKNMWAEAINCATYVMNRVPNSSNSKQTPYEIWHGHKPNVKNLRIFGELAVIKKHSTKLTSSWDEKGSQAIFLGYTDRSNTYRFLQANRITIECDVAFINKLHNGEDLTTHVQEANEEFWCSSLADIEDQHDIMQEQSTSESTQDTIQVIHEESPAPTLNDQPEDDDIYEVPTQSDPGNDHPPPPRPSTLRQSSASSGEPLMSTQEVSDFVERYKNHVMPLKQGNTVMQVKIGDLTYSEPTKRWKVSTGQFISRAWIKEVKNRLDQQAKASVARALLVNAMIPKNYTEASTSVNKADWEAAMEDEMHSLIENQVFEVVPERKVNKKPVGSRWVYTIKTAPNGEIEKHKARVVAKGYTQVYGVDFEETYCSVVHILSTRLLINYASMEKLTVKQFDIKTAFLYAELNEEIYMIPPEGYAQAGTLWKLKRSLYGLRQSPRMWGECFSNFIKDLGFESADYDSSIFYRFEPLMFIMVYVDDGLIIARDQADISNTLDSLHQRFKMREMKVNKYRGLEIVIKDDGIFIHQESYARKILETFNMVDAKPTKNPITEFAFDHRPLDPSVPYKSAVSSLAYLADISRPDISFAVNQLQRKMSCPTESDWKQTKQVLRYVKSTINYGIMYKSIVSNPTLIGYSDSDFAGDFESSKSTTGYVILFNDAPIHWKSQLQRHVTLSSSEAEVIALCSLSKQLSWVRRMMIQLKIMSNIPAVIKCDNTSALKIAQSEKATLRTRHLRSQDAYIREQVEENELSLMHVKSADQLADLLTKRVQTGQFIYNCGMLLTQQ